MANTGLVSKTNGTVDRCTCNVAKEKQPFSSTPRPDNTSTSQEFGIDCMSSVRTSFRQQGFSSRTTYTLLSSWKPGTRKQYQVYFKTWFQYCQQKQIEYFQATIGTILEFLTDLFQQGLGYRSLNIARGALSSFGLTVEGIPVGRHSLVIRYMKGVFNIRPSMPRYEKTWDVDKVLDYLRKLSPVKYLTLKDLTLKLTMLIAITNAARTQSIHLMNVKNVYKVKGEFIFVLSELVKQNRPGYKEPTVNIKAYPPDRRICVYTVYKEYMLRTKLFRGTHGKLLLSYVKPHEPVSRDSVSRWIKIVMARAGIDTSIYKSHSVRSASTSKAKSNSVPISNILKKAGWSNTKTFPKFDDRKIEKDSYSASVLKN